MAKQPHLKKGEFMPNMAWRQNYGAWKATRCNMFACDFSISYLPNKAIPWASQWKRAHEIYEILPTREDCIELDWGNAWDYINAGFPVYFVAPKKSEAGHIAIGYPSIKINNKVEAKDNGYIVQAGSTCGKKLVSQGFNLILPEENGGETEDDEIKIYMYVGHLKM